MAGWKERIATLLVGMTPREIPDESLARAAVLLPLVAGQGKRRQDACGPGAGTMPGKMPALPAEPYVLLTRRTQHVRYHKGQISLPGGARDGAEPLQTTALRETEEELGIPPDRVDLLGRFHDYLSSSNFRVTVFVGSLDSGARIRPSPLEVESVLSVPLDFFIANSPEIRQLRRRGVETEVYFYNWEDQVIWGLTARILKEFADALR